MLPCELPYGRYELIEVETCYGYVLSSEPVSFEVDGSQNVVVVEKHNMPQKGKSISPRVAIFPQFWWRKTKDFLTAILRFMKPAD